MTIAWPTSLLSILSAVGVAGHAVVAITFYNADTPQKQMHVQHKTRDVLTIKLSGNTILTRKLKMYAK